MAAPAFPHVYTVPASAPFLKVLIDALLSGRLIAGFKGTDDPLVLASATLYLPTRRACRLARDVFLEALGEAAILPRIVPIGDVDENEIEFASAATAELAEAALDLPPALSTLERRLLLAQLVAQWAASPGVRGAAGAPLVANTPAATLTLADALARLIDDMTTRKVPWDRLDGLVPDDLDRYWQFTLQFLQIARTFWPARLAELGAIESADRRDRLIAAEVQRLATSKGPVIAAGSTGSMPATAELLAAIAKLPRGAVVLPGLDTDLDEPSWAMIAGDGKSQPHDGGMPSAAHPQFAMQALLRRIGISRADVTTLVAPAPHGREVFVSEALRPAATTERWRERLGNADIAARRDAAIDSLTVVEAATAEEEALAIAIALREAVETPHKTAALVTPDRTLARRVIAALARWNVAADDSGGDSLADTPAGVFARLAGEAALGGLAPVTLLALLKHPLLRLGAGAGTQAHATETLERAVLRGPRPRHGTTGLLNALTSFGAELQKLRNREDSQIHRSETRAKLSDDDLAQASALAAQLSVALAPLETLKQHPQPFAALARLHRETIIALGRDDSGEVAAFNSFGGRELADALEDIATVDAAETLLVAPRDYVELFHATIAERIVRKPEVRDVRVRVFGPLEARLQQIDRVVLGGLVEGTWPPETRTDPWLSRPMRHQLGLDLPERRIGLSAHDFAQALGAPEVILTRAAKIGGAPTVMSRFAQRLSALSGEARWQAALTRGDRYVVYARQLDASPSATPVKQPAPSPPREARPTSLSVTEIEHWLRDPYTIYARHILKLQELDPVDTPPGLADRGTVIHAAVAKFTVDFAHKRPDDPARELIALGQNSFASLDDFPEARAFWWPRFMRIAHWFSDWDGGRRDGLHALHAEIRGKLEIPTATGPFTLTVRADRIEHRSDGSYAVLDYKTGRLPGHDEVKIGFAPQLTLEAAILRGGGFKEAPAGGSVSELIYVGLKGGQPPGEHRVVRLKDSTPDAEADRALAKLKALVARFNSDTEPYRSLVNPMWRSRYGSYDHLARVKEWSVGGDEEAGS